jgi:hypothetical protein
MKIYLGYAKTYRDKIYPKPPCAGMHGSDCISHFCNRASINIQYQYDAVLILILNSNSVLKRYWILNVVQSSHGILIKGGLRTPQALVELQNSCSLATALSPLSSSSWSSAQCSRYWLLSRCCQELRSLWYTGKLPRRSRLTCAFYEAILGWLQLVYLL